MTRFPAARPSLRLLAVVLLTLVVAGCLPAPDRAAVDGGGEPPTPERAGQVAPDLSPVPAPYPGTDEARATAPTDAAPQEPLAAADAATPPACPAPQAGTQPPPVRVRPPPPPPIGATAAVVIDGGSGAVLWGREEHTALQPASVTKILTALIAVERGNLDEVIPVTVEQRLLDRGTRMGLVTGDWFTLRDLLYGLMLPSGNDAATVIAHHFAGSEAAFAGMMNARLCELGLTDSLFLNSSGLGRTEYNLASAYDLAQLTRAAMEYPAFRELAAARTWTARGSRTLTMRNLNELVGTFAGADGVKIGWTRGAGNTIVASATRNQRRVIVVLLNTPNRAGESAALLEWAFASFRWQP
jgi:serine-type D-Ala-D-Ala carboxypeptidase (penicillin-binding protein 5/6)